MLVFNDLNITSYYTLHRGTPLRTHLNYKIKKNPRALFFLGGFFFRSCFFLLPKASLQQMHENRWNHNNGRPQSINNMNEHIWKDGEKHV
jgi:hypothetical protein